MSAIESLATWLETTRLATVVGQSLWIVASLSAVHVLGYALVMSSAFVANLRLMGVLLPQVAMTEVTRPASRGISLGLAISIVTGIVLVSFKATAAFGNPIFQSKMLLLLAAAVLHFTWQRTAIRRGSTDPALLKLTGAIGLALWLGLAAAGCAYILFE